MKYTPITTEKVKHNVWIAKTILSPPLNCEVSVKSDTEEKTYSKLVSILEEE